MNIAFIQVAMQENMVSQSLKATTTYKLIITWWRQR